MQISLHGSIHPRKDAVTWGRRGSSFMIAPPCSQCFYLSICLSIHWSIYVCMYGPNFCPLHNGIVGCCTKIDSSKHEKAPLWNKNHKIMETSRQSHIRFVGFMWALFLLGHLNYSPILEWHMEKSIIMNGHQKDTCDNEIGVWAQKVDTILGSIVNANGFNYERTRQYPKSSNSHQNSWELEVPTIGQHYLVTCVESHGFLGSLSLNTTAREDYLQENYQWQFQEICVWIMIIRCLEDCSLAWEPFSKLWKKFDILGHEKILTGLLSVQAMSLKDLWKLCHSRSSYLKLKVEWILLHARRVRYMALLLSPATPQTIWASGSNLGIVSIS